MKAVICERYGPPEVLRLQEVPKPAPEDDQILVNIKATTVTSGDIRIRSFNVPFWEWLPSRLYLGVTRPRRKILGMELAGDVVEVGQDVRRFKAGDPVFAFAGFNFGAYAQYICLPENSGSVNKGLVAHKPASTSYEEAAAATGGALTALGHLKKGQIQPGQQVLIYGASGSIGTFAVQLARHFGGQVSGVCSTANLEMVRSLGASPAIDYTQEDFAQNGRQYDLIFDAVGKLDKGRARGALKENGIFLSAHGSASIDQQDLDFIKTLLEAGQLTSVIDRCYPLGEIVQAHHYVGQGHKKGNVVITVPENGTEM